MMPHPPPKLRSACRMGQGRGTLSASDVTRIESLVTRLQTRHNVVLLSGDTGWERPQLERRFGTRLHLHFKQTPADKRAFVAGCQHRGATTMMVGDGLNHAGALQHEELEEELRKAKAETEHVKRMLEGAKKEPPYRKPK